MSSIQTSKGVLQGSGEGGLTVFRNGAPSGAAARRRAEAKLAAAEVEIAVDLGVGRHSARMWTCDLSGEYVRINAEYTT